MAVAAELMPHLQEKAPQGAITYLKRLYYDTAISTAPYALRCPLKWVSLTTLVEPSQILFGTDYPYLPENLIANEVNDLVTNCDLSAEALAAIEHHNARRLFPRFV
ncbi:amidohydrolase family protein [Scytonema sp. UIC 10036]|uniref:amidohydrolase family protein n=1 Tax=Scytonema sp. UIC 10036 TaxID=2304196 RepID=UPI0012DABC94|nr:amidohydrolase family protein [Scytonema sp. UIC 10036]MUG96902.1 amidohydrolase family protein [Scytonema sp. UIC 10036]